MNLGDTETLHRGASGVDLFGFRDGGLRLLSYELSSETFCHRAFAYYQVYSLALVQHCVSLESALVQTTPLSIDGLGPLGLNCRIFTLWPISNRLLSHADEGYGRVLNQILSSVLNQYSK